MFSWFKKEVAFSYPLDTKDAIFTGSIIDTIPADRRYMTGPFVCDTSPDSHTGKFKNAIDFVVPDGSSVLAAKSGVVIDISEKYTEYGGQELASKLNYVTIDHQNGLFSQYAHLAEGSVSAAGLAVGSKVLTGQLLGKVGKVGWVEYGEFGDHLHFMVFKEERNSFASQPVIFKQ